MRNYLSENKISEINGTYLTGMSHEFGLGFTWY